MRAMAGSSNEPVLLAGDAHAGARHDARRARTGSCEGLEGRGAPRRTTSSGSGSARQPVVVVGYSTRRPGGAVCARRGGRPVTAASRSPGAVVADDRGVALAACRRCCPSWRGSPTSTGRLDVVQIEYNPFKYNSFRRWRGRSRTPSRWSSRRGWSNCADGPRGRAAAVLTFQSWWTPRCRARQWSTCCTRASRTTRARWCCST